MPGPTKDLARSTILARISSSFRSPQLFPCVLGLFLNVLLQLKLLSKNTFSKLEFTQCTVFIIITVLRPFIIFFKLFDVSFLYNYVFFFLESILYHNIRFKIINFLLINLYYDFLFFVLIIFVDFIDRLGNLLADPGKARGCSINTSVIH